MLVMTMETHPVVVGSHNGNSPLVWDETMLSAMQAFNRRNQPVLFPICVGEAIRRPLPCRLLPS